MLKVDATLQAALRTHHEPGVRAAAFYGGALVADVGVLPSGSLTFNGDAEVQGAGSVVAAGNAPSLVPHSKGDPLATYGQELALWRTVTAGGVSWEIPLGRYRITDSGGAVENFDDYGATRVLRSWQVSLKVADRFEVIRADDFLEATGPVAGNTAWDEIRRLSPVPVQISLPDAAVPPATVYDNRLGAIRTLSGLMGGVPHMTREGVLTVRPKDAWMISTVPVFDIKGVIEWDESMSNDFHNQVQVTSSNNNDLVAVARITDLANPLAVGRAGGRTFKHSSPVYTTQAAVDAAAQTILARVSTRRSRVVNVVCGPEAVLLELGDFGWVRDPRTGRAALGEVAALDVPLSGMEGVKVTLIVSEAK